MIIYLAMVDAGNTIHGCVQHEDGEFGPPREPGEPPTGVEYKLLDRELVWGIESPTAIAKWLDGKAVWVETAPLPELVARGLDAVDTPADQARAAVLVKQTQNEEYRFAERDAREYRAAGYSGTPGRGVSGWAAAKHRDNWTPREACDDILVTADRWINLLYDIRDLRLAAKENIRHAADGDDIRVIVTQFKIDLTAAMQGLQ